MDTAVQNGWLEKALSIQGWMTESELQWLNTLATDMQSIVEVGSWKGRSTVALAAGCRGQVCAVDTWLGSPDELESTHAEAKTEDIFGQFLDNTSGVGSIAPIRAFSLDAGADARIPETVDMVFIDAQHTADAVEDDIRAWLPRTGKIICGHDFNFPGVKEGIYRVFKPYQVKQGAGAIWWVDVKAPLDNREVLAVCLPGSNFSRAWLAGWNELYPYLHAKFRLYLYYAESNNIYQVRNITANLVLNNPDKPKYVLWIDSDNVVSAAGFEWLYQAAEAGEEVSAVGGWYRFFGPNGSLVAAGTGPDARPTEEEVKNCPGLMRVGYIGFGFLLMRYEVLADMGESAFTPVRWDGTFCTDDGGFCDHAGKKGYKFYIHPKVFAPHLKLGEVPAIRPVVQ